MTVFYLASGLENIDNAKTLRDQLTAAGFIQSYDWTKHGPAPDRVEEISVLEINGVRDADVVVVLLPGGRGTHTELGAAIAYGKRVVLCAPAKIMEKTRETCAFYHHPHVQHVTTPEEVLNILMEESRSLR
jgi:nucleoside 2-deoxyribosyltransferase